MERIASVTSSYYKFAEAAILVFSVDNAESFHSLSQHIVDISESQSLTIVLSLTNCSLHYSNVGGISENLPLREPKRSR
jgi:GTPase SAR1 family protein